MTIETHVLLLFVYYGCLVATVLSLISQNGKSIFAVFQPFVFSQVKQKFFIEFQVYVLSIFV